MSTPKLSEYERLSLALNASIARGIGLLLAAQTSGGLEYRDWRADLDGTIAEVEKAATLSALAARPKTDNPAG